jgi:hypothetical protein
MSPIPNDRPARRSSRRPHALPRQNRVTTRRRTRPGAPRQLVDVWHHADAEQLPGTTTLAGWLGQTILTLVTRYTGPGDRILLLPPPGGTRAPQTSGPCRRRTDPYAGLTEAVWTVTRLGRSTTAAVASSERTSINRDADRDRGTSSRSESGPGSARRPCRPDNGAIPVRAPRRSAHQLPTGPFDLIITAADPQSTDWLAAINWDRLVTSSGLVAVLTHSDIAHGLLRDPVPAVIDTIRNRQRRWRDHIAVLSRATQPGPSCAGNHSAPVLDSVGPAFHDLLILGPLASTGAMHDGVRGRESSDG